LLAGVTGTGHAGEEFGLELLALPLIHEGRTGARVLGALAPGGIPVWIGTSAIGNLTLGTFRYVPVRWPRRAECVSPLCASAHVGASAARPRGL
jgi:hypothetical protein